MSKGDVELEVVGLRREDKGKLQGRNMMKYVKIQKGMCKIEVC